MKKKIAAIVIRQNGEGQYHIQGRIHIFVRNGDVVIKMKGEGDLRKARSTKRKG